MFGSLFSPARHLAAYVALPLYKPYALFNDHKHYLYDFHVS